MDAASGLSSFFEITARLYEPVDLPIARALSDELVNAAERVPVKFERDNLEPEALKYLPEVLNADDWASREMQNVLAAISDHLPWKARMASAIGNDFHLKYAAAELIGSEGIVHSDICRLGLFLMVPNEIYASHHHAAEELYYVLSGAADWQVDDDTFRELVPGETTYHETWQPHATHTRTSPLLAIWGWVGDLDFANYRMVS